MLTEPPEPWRGFLADIDRPMASQRSSSPIELHCAGGFVVAMCYGLPSVTGDIDVFEVIPGTALTMLLDAAGKGWPLARKHGVYIDAGSLVATLPHNYASRLTETFGGRFARLRLLMLDRYDLALSKLERNIAPERGPHGSAATTTWDSNLASLGQGVEGARVAPGSRPCLGRLGKGETQSNRGKSLQQNRLRMSGKSLAGT
jgi:hypothetical protein